MGKTAKTVRLTLISSMSQFTIGILVLFLAAVASFTPAGIGRRLGSVGLKAVSKSTPENAARRMQESVLGGLKTATATAASLLLLGPASRANAAADDETVTDKAYLDISIDGSPAGRIVIGLFGNAVPMTAGNFLGIAKGTKLKDGRTLSYSGSPFHRIIPGFMNQGGDITRGDGRGGESIYGGKFADEGFGISNKEGYLSMANAGRDTNGSQFFLITRPGGTPWLDGKHVVFGKVVSGMEVAKKIESLGSQSGQPSARIIVQSSGVL